MERGQRRENEILSVVVCVSDRMNEREDEKERFTDSGTERRKSKDGE